MASRSWILLFSAVFLIFASLSAAKEANASRDTLNYTRPSPPSTPSTSKAAPNVISPGDYGLKDQDGKAFRLKGLLSEGKPVLLSFVYTGCGHACPALTARLKDVFNTPGGGFGDKFTALTIGIDPENDTPGRLRSFGKRIGADFRSWRFASADKETVAGIAGDVGFYYRKTGEGYDHMNMVSILAPSGQVIKKIYGLDFTLRDISQAVDGYRRGPGAALKAGAFKERELTLLDRIKLLCYTYDEKTGTYRIDYTMLISIVLGLIIQMSIVTVMVYLFKGAGSKP